MEESTKICNRAVTRPGEIGSLPLKKRRIMINGTITPSSSSSMIPIFQNNEHRNNSNTNGDDNQSKSFTLANSETSGDTSLVSLFPPAPPLFRSDITSSTSHFSNNREDEKIAALALVAARASSTVSIERDSNPSQASSQNFNERTRQPDPPPVSSEPNTPNTPRQRIYHPPLTQPLPNGCHGRTSRNNSYCRRYPRYNGSIYCKLHFQQYVLNNINNQDVTSDASNNNSLPINITNILSMDDRTRATDSNKQTKELEAGKAMARQISLTCKSSDGLLNVYQASNGKCFLVQNTKHNITSSGRHGSHHQDKKFSNLPGETPCKATTTRGRPCAYVSVNSTPYCHLHAEYGTNPPAPRRGFGNGQNQSSRKNSITSSSVIQNTNSIPLPNNPATKISSQNIRVSNPAQNENNARHSNVLDNQLSGLKLNINAAYALLNQNNSFENNQVNGKFETKQAEIKYNGIQEQPNNNSHRNIFYKELSSDKIVPDFKNATLLLNQKKNKSNEGSLSLPLLSNLDSIHWENKRVRIVTGPLARHSGRILRGGNGWVTIKTYVGLHNRRAFELQILPDILETRLDYDLADEPDESLWPDIQLTERSNNETIQTKEAKNPNIINSFDHSKLNDSQIKKNKKNEDTTDNQTNDIDKKEFSEAISSQAIHALNDSVYKTNPMFMSQVGLETRDRAISLGELATLLSERSVTHTSSLNARDLLIGEAARQATREAERYDDTSMIERKKGRADSCTSLPQSIIHNGLVALSYENIQRQRTLSQDFQHRKKEPNTIIDSNEFINKRVKVLVGLFRDQKGTVSNMNNGWVQVKLDSTNGVPGTEISRRGIELELLPDTNET